MCRYKDFIKKMGEPYKVIKTKSNASILKERHLKEMQPLLSKRISKEVEKGKIMIRFTTKGNKHL